MKVRFIVETTRLISSVIDGEPDTKRTHRMMDDCEVTSIEKAEKEIKELVARYNKEEERRYGKKKGDSRRLLRIIDEDKLAKCPTELIWDSYQRQELQGECVFCNYKFVDFFNRGQQQKGNFKHCLGFGQPRIKQYDLVIVFECPECFEKTQFHCNKEWYELYGEWIVEMSEVL